MIVLDFAPGFQLPPLYVGDHVALYDLVHDEQIHIFQSAYNFLHLLQYQRLRNTRFPIYGKFL